MSPPDFHPEPEWLRLAGVMAVARRMEAGQAIFLQGDRVRAVFRVQSGRIRLRRQAADGSVIILHTALAGDTFAEAAVAATHYHCDGVAETESVVLEYPIRPLKNALETDHSAAMAFAVFLASQVRDLRSVIEIRNIRSARDRVLAWLRIRAGQRSFTVEKIQPWREVAHELGLAPEVLYRALAGLERDGLIRRETARTHIVPDASVREASTVG